MMIHELVMFTNKTQNQIKDCEIYKITIIKVYIDVNLKPYR